MERACFSETLASKTSVHRAETQRNGVNMIQAETLRLNTSRDTKETTPPSYLLLQLHILLCCCFVHTTALNIYSPYTAHTQK
jgi:hypothetical protein